MNCSHWFASEKPGLLDGHFQRLVFQPDDRVAQIRPRVSGRRCGNLAESRP